MWPKRIAPTDHVIGPGKTQEFLIKAKDISSGQIIGCAGLVKLRDAQMNIVKELYRLILASGRAETSNKEKNMIFKDPLEAAKKISPIFKQMGWEWSEKFSKYIPNEQEIYVELCKLSEHIKKNGSTMSACGRLFAEKIQDTGEIVCGLDHKSCDEWMLDNEMRHPI